MHSKIKSIAYLIILAPFIFISCAEEDDIVNPSDARDAFISNWNVAESCSKDSYSVQIVADPNFDDRVLIRNFWHIGDQETPPYAIVDGDIVTIPNQSILNDGSLQVHGNGTLNNEKITWYYEISDDADLSKCSATYEKK